MKKFKKKKIVNILGYSGLALGVLALLSLLLMLLYPPVGFGALLIIPSLILLTLADWLSELNSYTSEFIGYMENKYEECSSLNELYELLNEFEELAVDGGRYSLAYPRTLKELHLKLITSIQVLEKVNGTKGT